MELDHELSCLKASQSAPIRNKSTMLFVFSWTMSRRFSSQVMGNFSDPETPTEDVARAVSSSGHIVITPTARPNIVSTDRPSSPITIMVPEDPSPLLHVIAADPVMSQLSPPTPLPSLTAGHSPGVESTREYSESDVESPDTPGDLMGERLIP